MGIALLTSALWTGFIWFRIWTCGWLYEHGNKPLGSENVMNFFSSWLNFRLLKKDTVPWN
jgi:hypothetical protein